MAWLFVLGTAGAGCKKTRRRTGPCAKDTSAATLAKLEKTYQVKLTYQVSPPKAKQRIDALYDVCRRFEARLETFNAGKAMVLRRENDVVVLGRTTGPAKLLIKKLKQRLNLKISMRLRMGDTNGEGFRRIARLRYMLTQRGSKHELPVKIRQVFQERTPEGKWKWLKDWILLKKVKLVAGSIYELPKRHYEIHLQFEPRLLPAVKRLLSTCQNHPALKAYRIPATHEIRFGPTLRQNKQSKYRLRTYYIALLPEVTGDHVVKTNVGRSGDGIVAVTWWLDGSGEKNFRKFTRKNIKRQLVIIFDGQVECAPIIQSEIGARGLLPVERWSSRSQRRVRVRRVAAILQADRWIRYVTLQSARVIRAHTR